MMLNSLITGCVSYFAATFAFLLVFAFHEDSFQMNCYALLSGMILFVAQKKILLTGNSWNLFFLFQTNSSCPFKRMRKLSCGKDLQSRTSQLGSDTIGI